MKPLEKGFFTTKTSRKRLREIAILYKQKLIKLYQARPNFPEITDKMKKIEELIIQYKTDFNIILNENKDSGGGIENNKERIENMRESIRKLQELIQQAERILNFDTKEFEPIYRKQLEIAKAIVTILGKI